MIIALPSNGSNIDEHFGHCQNFTIVSIDDENQVVSEETLTPPPGCGCKSSVVPILARMGVSVMLAGNMGDGGSIKILDSNWGTPQQPKLIAKVKEEADTVLVAEDLDLVKWC